jgi:hypothetical protein
LTRRNDLQEALALSSALGISELGPAVVNDIKPFHQGTPNKGGKQLDGYALRTGITIRACIAREKPAYSE